MRAAVRAERRAGYPRPVPLEGSESRAGFAIPQPRDPVQGVAVTIRAPSGLNAALWTP